jgi:hypothetical protein
MWSLTSSRVQHISGPEKFGSTAKKGTFSTLSAKTGLSRASIFRFAAIARETVAIVGIHACGTYSLLDQKHSKTRMIHARFTHHRRRVRDRSCGRAPVGRAR